MSCHDALELLSAALDGEIAPAQQAQLDAHLAQCPACRALQAELLGMREALGALEASAPAELKEQIMSKLPPQQSKARPIYWRRWCAMAACAALVVLGVWQLPRFIFDTGKPADTASVATYDAPAADADEELSTDSGAALGALNDEMALPPYVEGDGVSVNAVPAPQPDPSGASYTVYGYSDAPAESPLAPTSSYKSYTSAPAGGGSGQTTNGALREETSTQSVSVTAFTGEGGAEPTLPIPFSAKRSSSEQPAPGSAPEAAPESAVFTGASEDGPLLQVQDLNASAEAVLVTSDSLAAPTEMADPFSSYCGVLTVERYEPTDQDFSVELWDNGLRQYILSAADFHALVAQLDSQSLSYELATEGEGIAPEAPYGLVIVTGPAPQIASEAP